MSVYYVAKCNTEACADEFDLERDDPSLSDQKTPVLHHTFPLSAPTFNRLFLVENQLDYITDYCQKHQQSLQVLTHPKATNTCYEKSEAIGDWNPLNVIKSIYLQSSTDQLLYGIVVPETGCFLNKNHIKTVLGLPADATLEKAKTLPANMSFGTCSPFIRRDDLVEYGGRVKQILFDTETLVLKRYENTLDDFSFGLDHRLSLLLNYYHSFKMLQQIFGGVVVDRELLNLSFSERFTRKNGRITINYEFQSLNYRTAQFINSIHGFGDVSILNDYADELDLPDVLTSSLR